MPAPKVLIIGCGLAGPVVASFYKRRGYDPVVFERVAELGDAGASLMLMPNGMNVLHRLGIADAVLAQSSPVRHFIEKTAGGELLAESDLPSSFSAQYGQPAAGIRRTTLSLMLKKMLVDQAIDLREGWKLVDIRESDTHVTAVFNNGQEVTGSFLVGCDGIKSMTRHLVLTQRGLTPHPPRFTGLVQTAGISPTPPSFIHKPAIRNWYGHGLHVIAYPVSHSHTSWAATTEERRAEETWRLYSSQDMSSQTTTLAALMDMHAWDPVVRDMVLSAERIVKFGIFDRDELQPGEWYSKRCLLIGDAAHPTSPHLGQGANQALEDSYQICHSMPMLDPGASISAFGTNMAETFFAPLAGRRQPRTSTLVRTAREIGELRVASDPDACRLRDRAIASDWRDGAKMEAKYRDLFTATFPVVDC